MTVFVSVMANDLKAMMHCSIAYESIDGSRNGKAQGGFSMVGISVFEFHLLL